MTEMEFGVRTVNKNFISDRENLYIQRVLELTAETQLTFR